MLQSDPATHTTKKLDGARINRRQDEEQTTMILQQPPNRLCLGRFLNAVANLKMLMGSPDTLDHTGAMVFYHRVVILAVATGLLGPRLTHWDITSVMLAAEDALHSEFDAYEDCFDDGAAVVPLDALRERNPAYDFECSSPVPETTKHRTIP
jgi:hypothetical protein